MDSSATETDDESPPDNPVHVGRRKKRRDSDDAAVGLAKKRLKRNHKMDSPKKKAQMKTRTIYSDSKVCQYDHWCHVQMQVLMIYKYTKLKAYVMSSLVEPPTVLAKLYNF